MRKAKATLRPAALDLQNKETARRQGPRLRLRPQGLQEAASRCADAELASAEGLAARVIQTQLNQYALITSPIDGIVLDRSVDAGQSVVDGSSSNASSLFTLAEDLSRMEIEAEVDELDIGSIKAGQDVRFTVEALPGRLHRESWADPPRAGDHRQRRELLP